MRVGTKSVLFGAHQFLIHPLVTLVAYARLYGFPFDPRLWLTFLVHDLGYVHCPTVEGRSSAEHVELGGRIMDFVAGRRWGDFARRHSRSWCHSHGQPYSRLCVADKLAFVLTPAWLYLAMVKATAELREYMAVANGREGSGKHTEIERRFLQSREPRLWLEGLKSYTRRWVEKHRNERRDGWTQRPGVIKKLMVRAAAR